MNRLRTLAGRLPDPVRSRWSMIAVIAIAIPYLVIVTLLHTRAVSPIDEWVYLDYLEKVPTQLIVHEGEAMSEESLDLMACVGVNPYGPIGPPCDHQYAGELDEFPNQGLSTASPYTPVYFAITWAVGGAIQLIPGLEAGEGWRLTGVLWFIGSLLVLFRLFRQFDIGHGPALAIGLAYLASPYSWWTYTYVGTDAPAVLVGALMLTLMVDLVRGRSVSWPLVAVGVVGTMIKLTNVIGVALALLFAAIVAARRLARHERPVFAILWPPALALAVGVASQLVWLRVVHALAVSDSRADQGVVTALDLPELLLQTTNFLPGVIVSNPIGPYTPTFVFAPLSWLCIAGVVAIVLTLRARQATSSLVLAVALASMIAAPVLAVALQIATRSYFQLPPRYGATILPGILLMLALGTRFRVAMVLIAAYSVVLLAVEIWLSGYLAGLA